MNLKEEFEEKFFTEIEFPNHQKIPVLYTAERRAEQWTWIEQQIKQACDETGFETSEYYQAKIKQACDKQKEICAECAVTEEIVWALGTDINVDKNTILNAPYPEGVEK